MIGCGVNGFRLLLLGLKYMDEFKANTELAKFFQDTDRMFKDDGVPYHSHKRIRISEKKATSDYIFDELRYGPRWTSNRIIDHVRGS